MNSPSDLLLDVSRLIWRAWSDTRPTGIDRVCRAYLAHYGPRARAVVQHRYVRRILDRPTSQQVFASLLADGVTRGAQAGLLAKIALTHPIDRGDARGAIYLNVGHTGLNQGGLSGWIARRQLRPVYLIHDLIPISHPHYCREGEAARHVERVTTLVSTAAGIVANSRVTADALGAFVAEHGLPARPTLVSWLGTPPLPSLPIDHEVAPEPYFVAVGTIEGRKNIDLLLDTWEKLARRLDRAPRLHLVGRRGWRCEATVARLDRNPVLRALVVEHGDISDHALVPLLRGARALLFPSFVEGYGLPLVEALHLGTPAIVSDIAAFREIAADLPDFLSPTAPDDWATHIEAFTAHESPERAAAVARLTAFVAPTWDDHFNRVDAFLGRLAPDLPIRGASGRRSRR